MSVLQTSVSKVRLTNWIPPMGFGLEEEGVLVASVREGRELIPPCSLNELHDTAALVLFFFPQRSHIITGIPREILGRGFPGKKRENLSK